MLPQKLPPRPPVFPFVPADPENTQDSGGLDRTARTVLEWIAERRMPQARRLLLETDENLSIICNQVGYRDRNSLSSGLERGS